jgi:hypothetical protein
MELKCCEIPTRRTAMRGVGALGLSLLTSLSLTRAASAKKKKPKSKPGPPGPTGPAGAIGPTGPAGSALATRVVFSTNSSPLPVTTGSTVQATAACGGQGSVVSCGHQVNGDTDQLVNVIVTTVKTNNERSSCEAELLRVFETGSVAGATIQSVAICLV